MAYVEGVRGCCGVKEISDLSYDNNPKATVNVMWQHYNYNPHCAHAFFTQAGSNSTYGEKMRDYIVKHNLGSVVETPSAINPNSSNPIIMYVWTVDWKAVSEHLGIAPRGNKF